MAFWQGYTPDNKLYIAVGYGWNAGAGQWEFNNVYSFFYYDADGQRVRKDDSNGTTAYAGPRFEQNAYTGVQRATYSFNGQVVAVRNGATTSWVHSDHLGSASLATDYVGVPIAGSETRYTPWGEVRTGGVGAITDRGFTSQDARTTFASTITLLVITTHSSGSSSSRIPLCRGRAIRRRLTDMQGCSMTRWRLWTQLGMSRVMCMRVHSVSAVIFTLLGDPAGNVGGIVAQQVVAHAGAEFTNGDATWAWHEQWWVAQGVMALASKMGGYAQLRTLLGGIATEFRRVHNLGYQVAGEAYGAIFAGRNLIKFADWGFRQLSEGIANDKSATEIEQYRILGVRAPQDMNLPHYRL